MEEIRIMTECRRLFDRKGMRLHPVEEAPEIEAKPEEIAVLVYGKVFSILGKREAQEAYEEILAAENVEDVYLIASLKLAEAGLDSEGVFLAAGVWEKSEGGGRVDDKTPVDSLVEDLQRRLAPGDVN